MNDISLLFFVKSTSVRRLQHRSDAADRAGMARLEDSFSNAASSPAEHNSLSSGLRRHKSLQERLKRKSTSKNDPCERRKSCETCSKALALSQLKRLRSSIRKPRFRSDTARGSGNEGPEPQRSDNTDHRNRRRCIAKHISKTRCARRPARCNNGHDQAGAQPIISTRRPHTRLAGSAR